VIETRFAAVKRFWSGSRWRRRLFRTFIGLGIFWLLVPTIQFDQPTATVVEAEDGQLLAALVAVDGQWRFPAMDTVPTKFSEALLCYEDRWFYFHPGFNPIALISAAYDNVFTDKRRRGGSTLTMQLARLSRPAQKRTFTTKLVEIAMAVIAEIRWSKPSLLAKYAAQAPFGGNVVGLEAASWRYFNQSPNRLTWAEAAALAVLPNSPALVFPGKNEAIFLRKRNQLLKRMYDRGILQSIDYQLAISEPLPGKPKPLPNLAPHILVKMLKAGRKGERIRTTIQPDLQQKTTQMAARYAAKLAFNEVFNVAVMVLHIPTGEVRAYVNSSAEPNGRGAHVDVIDANRSYGSLLKPFLYAAMVTEGSLLPNQLVEDKPVAFAGFMPQNFLKDFDGMVAADEVLSRSLNVPSVNMLRAYGTGPFLQLLNNFGFSGFKQSADHYGLSLILGGTEAQLWQLGGAFGALAHRLKTGESAYSIRLTQAKNRPLPGSAWNSQGFSRAAIWFTLNAITTNKRPVTQTNFEYFPSSRRIAWKTGTSFGHRDAWAIGVTPDYVVGVWAGNASGEGRPGLTGVLVAAPIMFDLFYLLPENKWFAAPDKELKRLKICKQSGLLVNDHCPQGELQWVQSNTEKAQQCRYHRLIQLDSSESRRVNNLCYDMQWAKERVFFVLPAATAYYFRQKHMTYELLPPWAALCTPDEVQTNRMQFAYPAEGAKLYLPLARDSVKSRAVFEVHHANPDALLYWHLDQEYVGLTQLHHRLEIAANKGWHRISVVDDAGNSISRKFEVISQDNW